MVCVGVVLCFVTLVFFFKQKTAYEMRISDWSSDVCSSDLFALRHVVPVQRFETGAVLQPVAAGVRACGLDRARRTVDAGPGSVRELRERRQQEAENGRASCRERVCQYV